MLLSLGVNAQNHEEPDSARIKVMLSKEGKKPFVTAFYVQVFKNSPVIGGREQEMFSAPKTEGAFEAQVSIPLRGLNMFTIYANTFIDTKAMILDGITFRKMFNGMFGFFFLEKGDDITVTFNADESLKSIEGIGKEKLECLVEISRKYPYATSKTLTEVGKLDSFALTLKSQRDLISQYRSKLSVHADSMLKAIVNAQYGLQVMGVLSNMAQKSDLETVNSVIEKKLPNDFFMKSSDLSIAVSPGLEVSKIRYDFFRKSGNLRFITDSLVFDQQALPEVYNMMKLNYDGVSRDLICMAMLNRMAFDNNKALNKAFGIVVSDFLSIVVNDKYREVLSAAYHEKEKAWKNLMPGASIPKFQNIVDYEGKQVSFESLKGKVVYVDFWAYWCKGCRNQIQNFAPKFVERLKDRKDIVFVFVSIDEDDKAWKQAVSADKSKKLGLHWKLIGESGLMAQAKPGPISTFFNIDIISRAVIIGKDGTVVNAFATPYSDDATYAELINAANK